MTNEVFARLSTISTSNHSGSASLGRLPISFRSRNLAFAAGLALIMPLALRAQQPYAYLAAPQYQQPQYAQPAPQYPQQLAYAQQQGAQPDNSQQQQYAQPQDADSANAYDQMGGSDAQPTPTQPPLSADQLEQLLAPVALDPDALLAQILAASTYPAQIAAADQWLHQMNAQGYNDPNQIVAGADAQTGWDPSVKALTAFPQVLEMLNQNLEWTTDLGNAYYNQPQDVMQTVQVLRDRAQQAGTLQSSPQEEVTEDQGNIDLAPATPDEAYVPAYNPWSTYGAPIAPYPDFSYSQANMLGGYGASSQFGALQFGAGIAMAAFERAPWGWLGWGLNWIDHSVMFNHSGYSTRSATVADWGFMHGGPRANGWRGNAGFGNSRFDRHPEPYTRAGGYDGRGQGYRQPGNGFNSGGNNGWNRGEPRPVFGTTHPAYGGGQAYNSRAPFTGAARPQEYASRPQPYAERQQYEARGYNGAGMYGRTPNAYNYGDRPAQGYATRPGMAYASPYRAPAYQAPAYRAPQYESQRGYSSRPSQAYGNAFAGGNAFARNEKSGGFHLFGGGHDSGDSSYRAPKNYGGGRESRSFGHESAPKMSHGGGGHFGGGHGGGGGGHSGGGHHRF